MLTDDQIHRINQLARLSREQDLTEEEKAEQHHLRAMYVAAVKRSLQTHLDYIRPQDQDPESQEKPGPTT